MEGREAHSPPAPSCTGPSRSFPFDLDMNAPPLVWVFAKWPEPGKVKTRLCPPLTPQQAAELAGAFLADRMASLPDAPPLRAGIAYDPPPSEDRFRAAYPDVPLKSQGDGSLGERMARVVGESLTEGSPAVMLLGSDVPLLPPSLLVDTARRLLSGKADLVLTPSPDGGYSMVGQSRLSPALYREMEWSTEGVLAETLRRAAAFGLRVRLTEPFRDCDTPQDLAEFVTLASSCPDAFRGIAPRTYALLHGFRPLLVDPATGAES